MKTESERLQSLRRQQELNQEEITMRERIVEYHDGRIDAAMQSLDKAQKWTAGFAAGFFANAFGLAAHSDFLEQMGQYVGLFETTAGKAFGTGLLVFGGLALCSILNQNKKEDHLDRTIDRRDAAADLLNDAIAKGEEIQDNIARTEKFERITQYGTELYEQARQEEMQGISGTQGAIKLIKSNNNEAASTVDNGIVFDPTN